MSKKHFIALADCLRELVVFDMQQYGATVPMLHYQTVIDALADFCASQNPAFDRLRWLRYIAGECGPNGGKLCNR